MAQLGQNIILLIDGSQMAAVKSHEVNTTSQVIEVASPTDGEWEHYIAGRKGWSLSAKCLVLNTAVSNIEDVLKVGQSYSVVSRDSSGNYGVTGTAICTACRQTYTTGNLVQGDFSFKGTGQLLANEQA